MNAVATAIDPHDSTDREPIVRRKMPELDSLRGVAILLVVFFHGFGLDSRLEGLHGLSKLFVAACLQGWTGVNVFFALSGFLITGILLDAKDDPAYYRRFYIRRAVRILPAYYAVLAFFAVGHGWSGLQHDPTWPFLGFAALYLANLSPVFGVVMGYGCLWSLAVEEQFYIVWPWLVRRLPVRALAGVALAIIVLVPTLRAYAFAHGLAYTAPYTWFVADGLAMGALVAIVARRFARASFVRFANIALALGIGLVILGAPFGILTSGQILGGALRVTAVNLLSTGLLGVVLVTGTGPRRSLVRWRVLSFFGEISYGLYLFHIMVFDICDAVARRVWPAMPSPDGRFSVMVIRFVAWGSLAVAVSTLSRRTFEERFLQLKKRYAP